MESRHSPDAALSHVRRETMDDEINGLAEFLQRAGALELPTSRFLNCSLLTQGQIRRARRVSQGSPVTSLSTSRRSS